MSEEQKINATVHNFKNEWKYKVGGKQKATTGEFQLEAKAQSDTVDLLPQTFVNLLKDTIGCMEENGFRTVPPKGYKPKEDKKKVGVD